MGKMLEILNSCFYRQKMRVKSCDMIFFSSDEELYDESFLLKSLVWSSEACIISKTGVKEMPRNQETCLHLDHKCF